jgi:P27 family predicted phage terminase small subunit
MKTAKAPQHLSQKARRWWQSVARTFKFEDYDLQTLTMAAEALDRAEEARLRIEADGAFIQGRYGLRAHPAIAVERDSRIAFARICRELNLSAEPGKSQPPALRGY